MRDVSRHQLVVIPNHTIIIIITKNVQSKSHEYYSRLVKAVLFLVCSLLLPQEEL